MRVMSRVYFFRNGQELTDHPANGLGWMGCGANHSKWTSGLGATDALEVLGRDGKVYAIFPEDLGGACMVKMWYCPGDTETRAFCRQADALAKGAKDTGHNNDHWQVDGRETAFQGWGPWAEYLAKQAG